MVGRVNGGGGGGGIKATRLFDVISEKHYDVTSPT